MSIATERARRLQQIAEGNYAPVLVSHDDDIHDLKASLAQGTAVIKWLGGTAVVLLAAILTSGLMK